MWEKKIYALTIWISLAISKTSTFFHGFLRWLTTGQTTTWNISTFSVNRRGVRSRHRHCPQRKVPSFEGSEVSPEIVSSGEVLSKWKQWKQGRAAIVALVIDIMYKYPHVCMDYRFIYIWFYHTLSDLYSELTYRIFIHVHWQYIKICCNNGDPINCSKLISVESGQIPSEKLHYSNQTPHSPP